MERLDADVAARSLVVMNKESVKQLLAATEPLTSSALLSRLDPPEQERLLSVLEPRLATEFRQLMSYPEGTAGSIMDPRVTSFQADLTADEVLSRLQVLREKRIRDLFLVDDDGLLVGAVPIHAVIVAEPNQRLRELARGAPPSVLNTAPLEEVTEALSQLRLSGLPVVDVRGRLTGVIRQPAMVDAVREEAIEDMQAMVGAGREERALSSPGLTIRKRLPWLNVNLVTVFVAAAVVALFEGTIAQFTALAVLLPVVAGQSGNTGAQALAVTMRGLALREIRVRHWPRVMVKEAVSGFVNGVAIAVVTGIGVYLWSGSGGLAGVIAVAMVVSMMSAGISGTVIPMVLTAVGQDPAQSSSIILTTLTDVIGFLTFLGLATAFTGML
jgi:magnesium transporter